MGIGLGVAQRAATGGKSSLYLDMFEEM